MSTKRAETDHPIHQLLAERWSPYGFDPTRKVAREDLLSLFEAARWAASSYNEQPWRYLVASRDDEQEFRRLLACLVEGNRTWAQHASVLMLGVVSKTLSRNQKPNKAAIHDLGLASANLTLEATARGLSVHQMIGIQPDVARSTYGIPEDFEPYTALALGYAAAPSELPEQLRERDQKARQRRPLREFVFGGGWARAADVLG